MSEDLIKRSDAIEAVMNTEPVFAVDSLEPYQKTKDVVEALEAVPAADRPSGEWVYGTDEDGNEDAYPWTCSICGEKYPWYPNYCPHCGAKMKGADDEADRCR